MKARNPRLNPDFLNNTYSLRIAGEDRSGLNICGTLHDPREGLWRAGIEKNLPSKHFSRTLRAHLHF